MAAKKIRVTVWNEFRHEKKNEAVRKVYPDGMHCTIQAALAKQADMQVRTATLDEPEHGLTEAVLKETDVLTWWGHVAHGEVQDAIVDRVQKRVLENHKVPFTYDDSVLELIGQRCTELERGARMVDAMITNTMLPEIGREFLGRLAAGNEIKRVHVTAKDGNFAFAFD